MAIQTLAFLKSSTPLPLLLFLLQQNLTQPNIWFVRGLVHRIMQWYPTAYVHLSLIKRAEQFLCQNGFCYLDSNNYHFLPGWVYKSGE